MRRSICTTLPNPAIAGEIQTWEFSYTTAQPLNKGAVLKFELGSEGRLFDWEIPSTNLSDESNVIYLVTPNETIVEAQEAPHTSNFHVDYLFTLPEKIEVGSSIKIIIGAGPKSQKRSEHGNRCQLLTARRRPFYLSVDPQSAGKFEEPEMFTIDVKGGPLSKIGIHLPSFTSKNKRFDVAVRFEDQYGNLTSNAPEDTLIELTYEHLRENLNWKLFVPETGYVFLPNLYFNEAGTYRIQLTNLKTKETFLSYPIKCFQETEKNILWGQLHGEFCKYDAGYQIENCLRHIRDEQAFNFFASSAFDASEETSNELWRHITNHIGEFDEEDRFTTFLGFQYHGDPQTEGLRQFIFSTNNKPLIRKKELKTNSLKKIYKSFNPGELIAIPEFTMAEGLSYDFTQYNPQFERVVEIYNAWGSSETTKENGNTFPIEGHLKEVKEGSIIEALNRNCRFGFIAGGHDDRGVFASLYEKGQKQYTPGFTAIITPSFQRSKVFEALYSRHCYATTGARIIVGFYIAGMPMGSELTTSKKPGLKMNRHLSGYVACASNIKMIEVIRNGEIIHTIVPDSTYHCDYHFDDFAPLEDVAIHLDQTNPFAYYYLRVTQEDGHRAWSSPIWVDLTEK